MGLSFRLLAAGMLLALPVQVMAQSSIASGEVRSGTLSFDGRSTVGNFVGTTSTVTGAMTGGADLSAVQGWVEAPVNTLKTRNNHRDRDLNKSMESEKYPTMRFELASVTPGAAHGDTTDVTLHGTFKIHGVSREVTLPAQLLHQPGGLRLRADFPMNLGDYQIGGLSKMLGMLKMHPDIVVHVDVIFAQ